MELYTGFDFGPTVVIGMWFGIGLWILSQLGDNDVMSIFHDGGNGVANLLPVSVLVTYRIWKRPKLHRVRIKKGTFSYISENRAVIFVIFGTHHPNISRKWVIKHFLPMLTAEMRSDAVIVTSVKMQLTEEDMRVITVQFSASVERVSQQKVD